MGVDMVVVVGTDSDVVVVVAGTGVRSTAGVVATHCVVAAEPVANTRSATAVEPDALIVAYKGTSTIIAAAIANLQLVVVCFDVVVVHFAKPTTADGSLSRYH